MDVSIENSAAIEDLIATDSAAFREAIRQLNRIGIVTEKEHCEIISELCEDWNKSTSEIIREHGFTGGRLICYKQQTSDENENTTLTTIAVYDSSQITLMDVKHYLLAIALNTKHRKAEVS